MTDKPIFSCLVIGGLPGLEGLVLPITEDAQQADITLVSASALGELSSKGGPAIVLGLPDSAAALAEAMRHGAREVVEWPGEISAVNEAIERHLPDSRRPVGHAVFQTRLEQEVQRAKRTREELSLILFDVDNFGAFNEAHGYAAGDALVGVICRSLEEGLPTVALRAVDLPAHLGSDRFAIALPGTPRRGAAVLATRLRLAFERQGAKAAAIDRFTVSVGVAAFPKDGRNRAGLLDATRTALNAAKIRGRNRVVTFTENLREGPSAFEAATVEADLLLALDELVEGKMLRAAFQPIVRADGTIFAHEVLARPEHPKFPSPWHLFTAAERAGRVSDVGRIVREKAFVHMPDLALPTNLFVNLHPLEVNRELIAEATETLSGWADRVVFEVTEAAEIRDTKSFRAMIDELREVGFRIALDDLGSGYAGLNSLSDLEPDFVKLDMILVRRVLVDPKSERLVRHLLEFATSEGMMVVAEGVETREEAEFVIGMGCPLIQGYYFAKPGPPFPEVATLAPST